jgi:hypothetical protein
MLIVSFDIASKSLAMSIMDFNDKYVVETNLIADNLSLKSHDMDAITLANAAKTAILQIKQILNNVVDLKFVDVVDLVPNKKVSDTKPELRSSRLAAYLTCVDKLINDHINYGYRGSQCIKVFLEYQMSSNFKSNFISAQIMQHFIGIDYGFNSVNLNIDKCSTQQFEVVIIGPSLKNKINFDKSKQLSYFMGKYTKKYLANKAHAKNNLLFWLKTQKKTHLIEKIKNKNLDDIADSVIQALAWMMLKHKH